MNRRTFLLTATAFSLLSTAAVLADEDYVKDLVDLLKKQGYGDISVTRTFLGRVRIVAVNSEGKRELVCNPRTGEVLRDVMLDPDGSASASTQGASSGSSGSGNSGSSGSGSSGSGSGDNDDDDKGGDDDHSGHGGGGGDDNSGHGSSGSGNGGGNSNSGHGSGHD